MLLEGFNRFHNNGTATSGTAISSSETSDYNQEIPLSYPTRMNNVLKNMQKKKSNVTH